MYYHSSNNFVKKDFKKFLKNDNRLFSILEEDAKKTILKKKRIDDLDNNKVFHNNYIDLSTNYFFKTNIKTIIECDYSFL